ncbi:hypothetical protein RND71_023150 [Anisodus tanguticus]|uniref:Single-stranded DNA binding protein Ssb-like OB fold domain-containing protein n=1 Tax=Anisodus tanguticus TaxID=243964 RepID=A0AAE1RTV9_9SOLA|nr:hypothetical protein RND71_023150 [Anisodus tanguticus]
MECNHIYTPSIFGFWSITQLLWEEMKTRKNDESRRSMLALANGCTAPVNLAFFSRHVVATMSALASFAPVDHISQGFGHAFPCHMPFGDGYRAFGGHGKTSHKGIYCLDDCLEESWRWGPIHNVVRSANMARSVIHAIIHTMYAFMTCPSMASKGPVSITNRHVAWKCILQMRLAECLVGDETGMIIFTARNDQGRIMVGEGLYILSSLNNIRPRIQRGN